jgi:hypothetical protein
LGTSRAIFGVSHRGVAYPIADDASQQLRVIVAGLKPRLQGRERAGDDIALRSFRIF